MLKLVLEYQNFLQHCLSFLLYFDSSIKLFSDMLIEKKFTKELITLFFSIVITKYSFIVNKYLLNKNDS